MICYPFYSSVVFPKDSSLGGYGSNYKACKLGSLEVNSVSFDANVDFAITSIDSLYPGELVDSFPEHLFCASHTHYSPMIDSGKPSVGSFDHKSLEQWAKSLNSIGMRSSSALIDTVVEYRASVPDPIYRRFDTHGSAIERYLNPIFGMYPNSLEIIDRSIRIFAFYDINSEVTFCLVWHSCHPVSRISRVEISADYVGVIRSEVRKMFGDIPVLFFLGPCGDIRPNITSKRFKFLPDIFPNRRFSKIPSYEQSKELDARYATAIQSMVEVKRIQSPKINIKSMKLKVSNGDVLESKRLSIPGLIDFVFFPFEVSHRYHFESLARGELIVSCSGSVKGYLPHKSQVLFGGYEVDSSRPIMRYGNERYFLESVF